MAHCVGAALLCKSMRTALYKKGSPGHRRVLLMSAPIGLEGDSAWSVLAIPVGSSKDVIKKRFRKLATTEHPDVKGDDLEASEKFACLAEAYTTLMGLSGDLRASPKSTQRSTWRWPARVFETEWSVEACVATMNNVDHLGRSALYMAAAQGFAGESLLILEQAGFLLVNAKDVQGITALHRIARMGVTEVCEVILERDDFVEVNAKDIEGKTALHWAAAAGKAGICAAILGCPRFTELLAKDCNGRPASKYAAEFGHADAYEVLRAHGSM